MGRRAAALMAEKDADEGSRDDLPKDDGLPPLERKALDKIRAEAKAVGSELTSGGKGGLPPSLVLGVFRRDAFRCVRCGELGSMKGNGGLGVHHKGGIPRTKWLSREGHKNERKNLESICGKCHDDKHEEARDDGVDSSQVTPKGDEGTRRDKGLPPAPATAGE